MKKAIIKNSCGELDASGNCGRITRLPYMRRARTRTAKRLAKGRTLRKTFA